MTIAAIALLGFAVVVLVATLAYAATVSKGIRNDRDYLDRQTELNDTLLTSTREFVLASRESVAAVRQRIDSSVREYTPDVQSLAIFDVDGDVLKCVFASGKRVADYVGATFDRNAAALPAVALRSGEACSLEDEPTAKPLHPADRDAVAIPFALDAGVGSVVYVASDPGPPDGWEPLERLLTQAAPTYWVASERDQMVQQLTHDPLTGALTRLAFELRLREAIERGADFAVLYLDLDGFKGWNDAYGHQSGDLVLKQAADIMRSNMVSPHDLVARLGGDEFCMVLVDTPKSRAVERALEIGADVYFCDRSAFVVGDDRQLKVSACIGVATFPDEATSAESLVKLGDSLMYASKKNGKDRVTYRLENGESFSVCCSEYDRRDDGRPARDRRSPQSLFRRDTRPFVASEQLESHESAGGLA